MSQIIKKVSLILGVFAITSLLMPNTSEAGRRHRRCCQQQCHSHCGQNQTCGQAAQCGCVAGQQYAQTGGCSTCNVGGHLHQQGNVQAGYNSQQSGPPMAPNSQSGTQQSDSNNTNNSSNTNNNQSNPPAPPSGS